MARVFLTLAALLVAFLAVAYPLFVKPFLGLLGVGRVIESVGNTDCIVVPELQACESEFSSSAPFQDSQQSNAS